MINHHTGWVAFNPDDTTFGPELRTPVWLTDGRVTVLAMRRLDNRIPIRSQYVPYMSHYDLPDNPTHFAYAAPPLPKP